MHYDNFKILLNPKHQLNKVKLIITPVFNKGFFHLIGSNTLLAAFGFLSQLFVAWILKPEDIGTIKILQTYVSIFITLGALGYDVSVLKLCSENRNDGEKIYLFKKGLKYSFIGALLGYLIIIVLSFFHLFSIDNKINFYMILLRCRYFTSGNKYCIFRILTSTKKNTILCENSSLH